MLAVIQRVGVLFCVVPFLVSATTARSAIGGEAKARVLIVSAGGGAGGDSSAGILRTILLSTDRFDVRLCEVPEGLSAAMVAGFDLVVLDAPGIAGERSVEGIVEKVLASGKGVLITQRGLGVSPDPGSVGGEKEGPRGVSAFSALMAARDVRSPLHFMSIRLEQPEQPILKGISREFRVADAIPEGLAIVPGAEVLASAISAGKGGTAMPVLAVRTVGPGRVVGLGMGHDASAMHEPDFRAIVVRAAEWAATGAVTLAANAGVEKPKAGAVKALLVTGGHDHEVAFYNLFSGYTDLNWIPIMPSTTAFKTDLHGKYDVVIMYDFSRDLDDVGKKNLRAFVEKGGGVVVLHHALLNYQTWDWWIDDVVGGSYRLSRKGQMPSSRVKDNQQIYVTPAGEHAITAGIGPFHIQDEAYQLLRMSPKIKPLLTTDNPTSDRNLAWVGPDERYRVVAIQLGHGHTAFGHPSYRAVVHNAVLWAAGKTK